MADTQPIQVQRVGLSFAKHYVIRLPLALLYFFIISLPLARRIDPISADVLALYGIGFLLVGAWFVWGSAYSIFANPFYKPAQLWDHQAEIVGAASESDTHQWHTYLKRKNPALKIVDNPDEREARKQVYDIRMKNGQAMTVQEAEQRRRLAFWRFGAPLLVKFPFQKLPYYLVKYGHFIGLPLLALVVIRNPDHVAAMFTALVAFGVPLVILLFRPLKVIVVNIIKEHPAYMNFFRLGIGGPSGRFAGLRAFAENDMAEHFNPWLKTIPDSDTSDIYLGRTPFFEDTRMLGRDVGLKGKDTHMITVARTGSGKSRDAVWNTLLNYNGGVICFDPKGEHFRVAGKRRGQKYPVFLLDPYGSVEDLRPTDHWNPLDEIDIESDAARDQLANIAEASIHPEKGDQNAFFQENGAKIFRGFIAHVLTKYPKKDQHLGTVYDLLATGEPEGKFFSQKAFEKVIAEMMLNPALQGSAREAAGILAKVGERERGSYLSTLQRGLDWINAPAIRRIISKPSTFSLREAKTNEASIFLVLPDDFISQQSRFLRTFFSLAGEVCGDYITPQPTGSKRRVLMIFDEFNALGNFKPAQEIILRKRSAGIKCWFLLQNLSQLKEHFVNVENFMSSCDKQFFGIDQADTYAMEILVKSLGEYTEGEGRPGRPLPFERVRSVFTNSDIATWTNNYSNGQIVIPAQGKPMKLKRVPFFRNFDASQYGAQKTSA